VPRAPAIRPTRVEVDLDALRANAAILRQTAGTALYAVVKADAYGHGAAAVARCLADDRAVAGFAVSLIEEGSELRDAGIAQPILVMGPALSGGYDEIVGRNLTAVISDVADLAGLERAAHDRGRRVRVHVKVDTGMGRLGVRPERFDALLDRIQAMPSLEVTGLMTHFACADSDDPADPDCMTYAQLAAFDDAVARARGRGLGVRWQHTANSSAALFFPAARRDLVRCGLALYGNSRQPAAGGLEQCVRLVSHVAQIREVPAGSTVSYGALWTAPRDSRVAVVPIGYADGVPRRLTGCGQVLIAGRRCPLVGAVSMDIAMVDVTELGAAAEVDAEVVLLGRQNDARITVAELASWAGLTEYEVTCGLSKRVPRVYSDRRAATRSREGAEARRRPAMPEARG
jgi:alanine racemase